MKKHSPPVSGFPPPPSITPHSSTQVSGLIPQPSDDVLVRVENASKKFCRSLKKSLWYGMKDLGSELIGRSHSENEDLRANEFWAVKDVSFELKRGECLGLIGRNGAGKTTLLRMLNGLIKPDKGRIEMRGRVGALIALGAGFNPILTGRENIYVNASVLGLKKKEIEAKFDEIVEFAELGDFIDAPVQSYSSGMQVRLGFAVTTALEPDILIIDEVLAVGDVGFQIKCGHRIRKLASRTAVIFVSHNMQYVSAFCSRVIYMEHGSIALETQTLTEGIMKYFAQNPTKEEISGTCDASVKNIELQLSDGKTVNKVNDLIIKQNSDIILNLKINIKNTCRGATIRINILDESENGIISCPIVNEEYEDLVFTPGDHSLKIKMRPMELGMGKYSFLVAITDVDSKILLLRHQGLNPFNIDAKDFNSIAKIIRPLQVERNVTEFQNQEAF